MTDLASHCGICGGRVRIYHGTHHGRPVTDWKHASAPPGTAPHRPVLGRPADPYKIREEAPVTETTSMTIPPPMVPIRPATPEEVPPAAANVVQLAQDYGWRVFAQLYLKTAVGTEQTNIYGRLGDLGFIGCWERREGAAGWKFVDGWRVAGTTADQVGSDSLKAWIKIRQETCPDCGRSSINHEECS